MDGTRILVVEDTGIIAEDLAATVGKLGYVCVGQARTGEEAIRLAEETRPDLIVMDVRLAGPMDGIEAAARIRRAQDVPVVYLTAYADDETLERAKVSEPFGYLIKPFQMRELHSTIAMALYRHRIEKRLSQARKMEAVGILAGGVAHDFNNLLTGILGYAELLRAENPPGSSTHRAAEAIQKAAERAAELTRRLLGYARKGKYHNLTVGADHLARQVAAQIEGLLGNGVTLSVRAEAGAAQVRGDIDQLERALMHLAVNGMEAMPNGGALRLDVLVAELDDAFCAAHEGARPGRYAAFTVSDTGPGMSEEARRHLFEPFFTTAQDSRHRGLGLPMVFGIVKNHDGYLDVATPPAGGTRVTMYLPVA